MKYVLCWCVSVAILIGCQGEGMTEVFQWRQIDYYNRGELDTAGASLKSRPGVFTYPSGHHRARRAAYGGYSRYPTSPVALTPSSSAANSSSFIQYNNVPMGVSHHRGRLFVTVPRRRPGIPSTLNYIDLQRDGNNPSPKLRAYPDFETNYLRPDLQPNPNRLVSVYRTSVDECDRFWFIDTGILEYPGNQTQVQRPSLWVIDLKRDRRLLRFEISTEIAERGNGLASITVDVKGGDCSNTYAYIPDLVNRRLHVFDLTAKDMCSFTHSYFNFDAEAAQLNIAGQSLRFNDGIFSTTLGPRDRSGYRDLYFHPLASTNEFAVNTDVLQRRENTLLAEESLAFRLLGSRGDARQSTMHEYDPKTKVIFYNEIQRNGVGCWNTKKPFSSENHGTVIQDAQRMIYPSDLTIDQEGTIWVMSNSMPLFIAAQLDANTFNFRLWKRDAAAAAKGTVCE